MNDQPTEAKPHNPDNLTPGQIGTQDGWRLLDRDEIIDDYPTSERVAEQWRGSFWEEGYYGVAQEYTYRTNLTREELRKARGLDPEQPKPVTLESLAEEFLSHWQFAGSIFRDGLE